MQSNQNVIVLELVRCTADSQEPIHCPSMRSSSIDIGVCCRDIAHRPLVTNSQARLHFVDDRFETVQAVLEASDLKETKLRVYLADW